MTDPDAPERVPYDEFAYFADNAAEYGLAYDGPPTVRRDAVRLPDGRGLSALVWGDGPAEYVLVHGGAQNAHTWDTVALALGRPLVAVDLPGHGHSGPPAFDGTGHRPLLQDQRLLGRQPADAAVRDRAAWTPEPLADGDETVFPLVEIRHPIRLSRPAPPKTRHRQSNGGKST